MDTRKVRFGNYLKNMRTQAHLSQRELADRLGVTNGYISKLENANASAMPSLELLLGMADVFGDDISLVQYMAGVWDDKALQAIIEALPDLSAILIDLTTMVIGDTESALDVLDTIREHLSEVEIGQDMPLP